MTIVIIARLAVDLVSAIFVLLGLVSLSGSTHFRAVYRLWHYPHNFYCIIGLAELMVALFLFMPQTRIWGIAVSGMIALVTTVTLLRNRKYFRSFAVVLLLVSLIPASLVQS